jgi:hypothetical protein
MSIGNTLGLSVSNPKQSGSSFNPCSIYLDGTDQDIDIDSITGSVSAEQFTFSFWAKLGTNTASGVFFKLMADTTDNQMLCLWHGSGNEVRFTHKMDGTADVLNGGSGNMVENDNTWWHIAVTVDRATTNSLKLYINGVEKESITGVGEIESGKTLQAGAIGSNTIGGGYVNATMNSLVFWNRALGADEIVSIYNGRSEFNPTQELSDSILSYFPLNDGSGIKAVNKIDLLKPGTINNSPVWVNDIP